MDNQNNSPKKNKSTYSKLFNLLQTHLNKQTLAIQGIFIIILLYTLYFGREILLTMILSLLFYFILMPVVTALKRIYIRPEIGAALVLIIFFFSITYCIYMLSLPAQDWLQKMPSIMDTLSHKLESIFKFLTKPLKILSEIKLRFETLTAPVSTKDVQSVEIHQASFIGFLFNNTWKFFTEASIALFLTYFLLASEDTILLKIVIYLESLEQKKEAVSIARQTAHQIGVFLFVRTIINVILALVVSSILYVLDMPNPILWGVMTGISAFIPYVGALFVTIIITLIAIFSFDNTFQMVLIPTILFLILAIEGNFIAPYVLGRSLTLNPLTVFLAVIFWGWLWGIPGAFIGVPLVVTFKIIIDNLYEKSLISDLLSD